MNLALKHTAIFVIYLLLQVFIFNHFTLGDVATPHVFLLFLLMMPVNIQFPILVLSAFFGGLLLDLFSVDAFRGLHAFSCVLMVSLRDFWVNIITNRLSYRGSEEYLLQVQPTPWYAQYLLPLIVVHQIAYYLLEAFSFANFGNTLLKIGTSTVFTFALCMIFTLLFHRMNKR